MSKQDDVQDAVEAQLTEDGRWPPNDYSKVMGADYRYGVPSMGTFLESVRTRLANNDPPYDFRYDLVFVTNTALADAVDKLIADIDGKTKAAAVDKADGAAVEAED